MVFRLRQILTIAGAWLIIIGIILPCMTCSPQPQFTVEQLYGVESFSGAELCNRTIMVSPLFTSSGAIVDGELNSGIELPAINRKRRALRLMAREVFEDRLIASRGQEALDSFYMRLYKGKMVAVQNSEDIWKQVGSDFLMVLKLNYGLRIKSAREQATRRIRIEGELWDCDSMEVVWRVSVDGRGLGENDTDRKLLLKTVCRVFEALPKVMPGYGKGRW